MERFQVKDIDYPTMEPMAETPECSFDLKTTACCFNELATIAKRTLPSTTLGGPVDWFLVDRKQDIKIYRSKAINETDIHFRVIGCVKGDVERVVNYLATTTTTTFKETEKKLLDGFIDGAVLSSRYKSPEANSFPRSTVKWHGSKFVGKILKNRDMIYVEYSDIETSLDDVQRGYIFQRSVDSCGYNIPSTKTEYKRGILKCGVITVTQQPGMEDVEIVHIVTLNYQQKFPKMIVNMLLQRFVNRFVRLREHFGKSLPYALPLLPRNNWIPDGARSACFLCTNNFSFMRPRHHCRACGELVCGKCSKLWYFHDKGIESSSRVCTQCSLLARDSTRKAKINETPNINPTYSIITGSDHSAKSSSTGSSHCYYDIEEEVASVVCAVEDDCVEAVKTLYRDLTLKLGDTPDFMIVSYAPDLDALAICSTLRTIAPGIPFTGGSTTNTLFTEMKFIEDKFVFGLWGIYDREGAYAVSNIEFTQGDIAQETMDCLLRGLERLHSGIATTSPDFMWITPSPGTEEIAVNTIGKLISSSCSVIGGTAADTSEGFGMWSQICSEGDSVTFHGIAMAMCCPSVVVSHAFFNGHEPSGKSGVVTKCKGRVVEEINHKPAMLEMNMLCDGALSHHIENPGNTIFKFEGDRAIMHPLGRHRGLDKNGNDCYQLIQPVSFRGDMSFVTCAEVQEGETLHIMSTTPQQLVDLLALRFKASIISNVGSSVFGLSQVKGCFISLCACLVHPIRKDFGQVVKSISEVVGGSAFLGNIVYGEQGMLPCDSLPLHANIMASCLVISNRKKPTMPRRRR